MKLIEIKTPTATSADPVATILAAIEAAMDRSSSVHSIDVDSEEIFFSIGYDFPEHRDGVIQKVRAVAKLTGKLNGQKGGGGTYPGIDFQLLPKTALTDEQVTELKAKLKVAYPDVL